MPHALLPLPDVYESVVRRVAVAVTARLARIMHLPEQTLVYLPGNTDSVPMNEGEFGNCCLPNIRYPADSRLVVRYQEEANDNVTLVTPVNTKEHLPIFEDSIHDVVIRPVWRYVNFTVTLEYTSPNIVVAQRWLDEQRARISMGRAEQYTEVEYHYALPRTLMALFKILHDTMESSEFPTGIPFEQWLASHIKVPTTNIATLIGTNEQLAVVEKQMEVIGWFDFTDTPPTPERDANGVGTYTASINYTFRYSRPTHVACKFPFLMNQNPIPKNLREREGSGTYQQQLRRVSKTKGAFDSLLKSMQAKRLPYIHYPESDDWMPPSMPKRRLTFFTGLVVISKEDLRSIVDLSNMGTLQFTPFFLEYFFHQGNAIFEKGLSFIELSLYENNTRLEGHPLEMVEGTTLVRSKVDLDPNKYYHVQMSLVRNWYELKPSVYECLRRYPTVLYNALRALGVSLSDSPLTMPFIAKDFDREASVECPGEGSLLCQGTHPQLPWANPIDETCSLVIRKGIVKRKTLEEAIEQLDTIKDNLVNQNTIGPVTVLYADILTFTR